MNGNFIGKLSKKIIIDIMSKPVSVVINTRLQVDSNTSTTCIRLTLCNTCGLRQVFQFRSRWIDNSCFDAAFVIKLLEVQPWRNITSLVVSCDPLGNTFYLLSYTHIVTTVSLKQGLWDQSHTRPITSLKTSLLGQIVISWSDNIPLDTEA